MFFSKDKNQNIGKAKNTMDVFDHKWKAYQNEPRDEDFSLLKDNGIVNVETQMSTLNPIWIDLFMADVKIPEHYFKDKLVLDAGCGFGRNAYAMSELGAKVVAFDYTYSGCYQTYTSLGERKNVHVIRADVNHPPFKNNIFDFVMSWGVLHHTPNTKYAFEQISKLVKQNGFLWVHLYEKWTPPGYYITELVRFILQKLPVEKQYKLCRWFVLPKFIIKRKLLTSIAQTLVTGFALTQAAAFDTLSPKFNHLTSSKQLKGWFKYNGFKEIEFTNAKTNNHPIIKLLFNGEYGGFLMCRGKKWA